MDKFTVKIMSSVCKMSEITQEGISCKNYFCSELEAIDIAILSSWHCFLWKYMFCFVFFFPVVEVITKHRQPMTAMEAIYFIQPTEAK